MPTSFEPGEETDSLVAQTGSSTATNLSFGAYLWKMRWILGPCFILLGIAYIWAVHTFTQVDPITLFFLSGGALFLILYALQARFQGSLLQTFAQVHGFHYQRTGIPSAQSAIVLQLGIDKQFTDIVLGDIEQHPFSAFVYSYSVRVDRHRNRGNAYSRIVMSLSCGKSLPSFAVYRTGVLRTIDRYIAEGRMGTLAAKGYTQRLQLEGSFSQYFSVYIRPMTEAAVLSILTPDIMEALMQLKRYEVELSDDGALYVYSDDYLSEQKELETMYSFVTTLAPKLTRYAALQRQVASPDNDLSHIAAP